MPATSSERGVLASKYGCDPSSGRQVTEAAAKDHRWKGARVLKHFPSIQHVCPLCRREWQAQVERDGIDRGVQPTPAEEAADRVARLAVDILRPFARDRDEMQRLITKATELTREYAR